MAVLRLLLNSGEGAGDIFCGPFAELDFDVARDEGDGHTSIEHWRAMHTRFWAEEGTVVDDGTEIACLRFRLVT